VIFTSAKPLADALNAKLPNGGIVGIDGWTGIGKTTLGKALAGELNGSTYDLDRALTHDRNNYVPALRLNEIAEALAKPSGFLFVSGVCLRQVLEQVDCAASSHIYVKRMAAWGWADKDELEGGSMANIRGSSGNEAVRQEMRHYHKQWQPHLTAEFEFHRYD
jgi:energy-coupling factor transporter ATP-binding protein EcfA2